MRDCKRCDYVAEDRYEMDGHLWSEHEDDEDGTIICKFCEEKFASIANLMTHKKIKHREKIKICENYNAEGCPFEDRKCWFLHIKSIEIFKCNICDETFSSKGHFMQHRKIKHIEMVKTCRNQECFYKNSCWFGHGYENENAGITTTKK